MPKSYAVRLYISTGFNKGNIPSSPSVLETAPHYDVDAVFERQNRNNGSIRIKAQWDDIKDADYMMYSKSDQVQIPVGFKGYIRVPFESYSVPAWNAGLEGVDGILNLDYFSGNLFLTSDNTRFEDLNGGF